MKNNKKYVIRQSSEINSTKDDYFDWSIWIENGEQDISESESVEYLLHSTFPNRLREKNNVSNGFLLKSSGWGEFEILISIYLKSGETIQQAHWLTLDEDYINESFAELEVPEQENNKAQKVYISYSSQDIKKAIYVRDLIIDLGLEAVSGMNMNLSKSINDFIKSSIEDADLVLNIESGNKTEWQKEEHRIANELSKKIVTLEDNLSPEQMNDLICYR
jgi:transcription initiation factor IIF auxiliary subunit